jgi:hypothetical protein
VETINKLSPLCVFKSHTSFTQKDNSIHGRLSTKAATTESTDIYFGKNFTHGSFELVHGELSHDWIAQSRK